MGQYLSGIYYTTNFMRKDLAVEEPSLDLEIEALFDNIRARYADDADVLGQIGFFVEEIKVIEQAVLSVPYIIKFYGVPGGCFESGYLETYERQMNRADPFWLNDIRILTNNEVNIIDDITGGGINIVIPVEIIERIEVELDYDDINDICTYMIDSAAIN